MVTNTCIAYFSVSGHILFIFTSQSCLELNGLLFRNKIFGVMGLQQKYVSMRYCFRSIHTLKFEPSVSAYVTVLGDTRNKLMAGQLHWQSRVDSFTHVVTRYDGCSTLRQRHLRYSSTCFRISNNDLLSQNLLVIK